ncbi:MAG: hypothetical protein DBP02_02175 [gamma proteobacterium symbiont of Ctena orbiculata]|nr:MAG: hypothetical protein DBP02_02175 [gamma proteobacterium symbiont of Ctena orbiculata]
MKVRATKLGYYGASLRYPNIEFDYEYQPTKDEKLSAAERKVKTKEDVDKSSWMVPVTAKTEKPADDSANGQSQAK